LESDEVADAAAMVAAMSVEVHSDADLFNSEFEKLLFVQQWVWIANLELDACAMEAIAFAAAMVAEVAMEALAFDDTPRVGNW
jgi:hypothetical protein